MERVGQNIEKNVHMTPRNKSGRDWRFRAALRGYADQRGGLFPRGGADQALLPFWALLAGLPVIAPTSAKTYHHPGS